MPSTRRQSWFSLFRSGRGGAKGGPPAPEVRPCLEPLEDRVVPALLPTNTVINPIGASIFSLFNQSETVTTQTKITRPA
jgi:hypothetical protein